MKFAQFVSLKRRISAFALALLVAIGVGTIAGANPAFAADGSYQVGCTNPHNSYEHSTVTFYYTGRTSISYGTLTHTHASWGMAASYASKAMYYYNNSLYSQDYASPADWYYAHPASSAVSITFVWHDNDGYVGTCTVHA